MPPDVWAFVLNLGPWGFAVVVAWWLLKFTLNHMSHKLDAMHDTLKEIRDWMLRNG